MHKELPSHRCMYAHLTHATGRTQVGLAAAGGQYRQPPMAQVNKVPEQMAEEPPEGTEGVPLNLRAKGLTLTELRREGYRVDEMLLEFGVKELIEVRGCVSLSALERGAPPRMFCDTGMSSKHTALPTHPHVSGMVLTRAARRREAQSGYTVPEMKSGGVSVRQLLDGGCLTNSEMARIVFKAGYTLFDVHGADAFTADQLLYAGTALSVPLPLRVPCAPSLPLARSHEGALLTVDECGARVQTRGHPEPGVTFRLPSSLREALPRHALVRSRRPRATGAAAVHADSPHSA